MASLEDLTTDQLLSRAKQLEGSDTLLRSLTSNPETRETIQRAIKKVNPTLSIPEIDGQDALRGEIKTEREERLKLERRIQEDGIRTRLEKQRADIIAKHGLTEADMLEVEKLMTREVDPIPSYEGAALVFKASRQSATPTPANFSPPTFDMPDKDVWKGGVGNKAELDKIGMQEAYKAFNEIRSGKVAGNGSAMN